MSHTPARKRFDRAVVKLRLRATEYVQAGAPNRSITSEERLTAFDMADRALELAALDFASAALAYLREITPA